MENFIWLAVALVVLWIVMRVVFAITGFFIRLILIAGLILGAVWLYQRYLG